MLVGLLHGHDEARALAEQVARAGERAAALTRQLLAFSRKQVLQPRVLNLNELVANLAQMLPRLLGDDVELVTALAPQLRRVHADPGQLEQVLMNLAVNARDAMPKGGRLTIATSDVDLGEDAGARPEVPPGPYVLLAVIDTGCGMDHRTCERLFEPFFTTKEVGKGTGLGLATVYGIVKQSGGHVEVATEVGRGTTFCIYLPGTHEEAPPSGDDVPAPAVPRGRETVLVVEYEEGVRGLTSHLLRQGGYEVLAAATAADALEVAAAHRGPLHLLVTDVTMPQMSGGELARRLARVRPGVRVLYVSGYADDTAPHGVPREAANILLKPFTPPALARKVREVLDGPAGPPG